MDFGEDESMSDTSYHTYVVVLESSSASRFGLVQPSLEFVMPTPYESVKLLFRTKHLNEGYDALVPRRLWIDARGPAPSLDEAIDTFRAMARALVNLISFSANASVDVPDPALAFDITPGIDKREFRQVYMSDVQGIPRQGRRVDAESTVAIMKALDSHPNKGILMRTMGLYNLALSHWRPGWEIFAIAYLYMGMDALTKMALEKHRKSYLSKDELLKLWCIEKQQLDSEVRRRLLFREDTECYKSARLASDAFEHGFLPFDKIREIAAGVREKTAAYLRDAIMILAGVEEKARKLLTSPPYDKPLESYELQNVVRGYLIGEYDKLAAKGQEYPFLKWESGIKTFKENDSGEYEIQLDMKMKAVLGENVVFEPMSYEIYGPLRDKDRPMVNKEQSVD